MDNENIVIGFAGDVMIGRSVNSFIEEKGYQYPWGNVLPLLKSTDINVVNLETALTNSKQKVEKVFNFKAKPDRVKTLEEANIAIVNLANNHILDFSEEGLIETLQTLDRSGIKHVGAGMNEQQAASPLITTIKNIRLGVIGFTDNEAGWKAAKEQSGTNYINISKTNDREYALAAVNTLKKDCDVLIVTIHWGYNMQEEPSVSFVQFAHEMIEHGADIIHGHSAHIFQAIELYRNKPILYDTGDFVDDYAVDIELKNDHSFLFIAELDKKGVEKLQLIPVLISNCQVNLAEKEHYKWCINRMQQISGKFSTQITDQGEVMLYEKIIF